jgi:hypothetical protein
MAKSKYGSPESSKASVSPTKRKSPLKAGKAIPIRKKKTASVVWDLSWLQKSKQNDGGAMRL